MFFGQLMALPRFSTFTPRRAFHFGLVRAFKNGTLADQQMPGHVCKKFGRVRGDGKRGVRRAEGRSAANKGSV